MKISETVRKIINAQLIMVVFALVIGYFLTKEFKFYFLGVLFGGLFSIFKLIYHEKIIEKAILLDPVSAANKMKLNFLFRHFLTAGVLIIAAIVPFIDLYGTAIPIFTMQIAVYLGSRQMNTLK